MSPELLGIYLKEGFGKFSAEKNDIFSLGITFLRVALFLKEDKIIGMNDEK